MNFYVTLFDKNGNIDDIIDTEINDLEFNINNNNNTVVALLPDGKIFSFPILDLVSEMCYQGFNQERYHLTKDNAKIHIEYLNSLLNKFPDIFSIIGIVYSNNSYKEFLKLDISFKTNLLNKIKLPELPDPIYV